MPRTKHTAQERRRQQPLPYTHPPNVYQGEPFLNALPCQQAMQAGVLRVFCIPQAMEFLGKILNTSFVDEYITFTTTYTENELLLPATTIIRASALISGRLYEAAGSTKKLATINCAEIILHEMIRRQDPLLEALDPFTSVNFDEEPVEKAASSSHQSNTRFQFTAFYLTSRAGIYSLRKGLKIATTREDITPIFNFKEKLTSRLSVDGVDYDGIALTKAYAKKEAVSNALASLMQNEANPTIAPGNPSKINSRLPPLMNEREMEMVRLEVMDPTSSLRTDLKALKKLLFHLKTGQQTIKIVKFVESTEHTDKEYTAEVTIDGKAYVGVSSTTDEAKMIAAINTLAVIGLDSNAELSATATGGFSSIKGELGSSDGYIEHY